MNLKLGVLIVNFNMQGARMTVTQKLKGLQSILANKKQRKFQCNPIVKSSTQEKTELAKNLGVTLKTKGQLALHFYEIMSSWRSSKNFRTVVDCFKSKPPTCGNKCLNQFIQIIHLGSLH